MEDNYQAALNVFDHIFNESERGEYLRSFTKDFTWEYDHAKGELIRALSSPTLIKTTETLLQEAQAILHRARELQYRQKADALSAALARFFASIQFGLLDRKFQQIKSQTVDTILGTMEQFSQDLKFLTGGKIPRMLLVRLQVLWREHKKDLLPEQHIFFERLIACFLS